MRDFGEGSQSRDMQPGGTGKRESDELACGTGKRESDVQLCGIGKPESEGRACGTGKQKSDERACGTGKRESDVQLCGTGKRESDVQLCGTGKQESGERACGTGKRESDELACGTGKWESEGRACEIEKLQRDGQPCGTWRLEQNARAARKGIAGPKGFSARDREWKALLREAFEAPQPLRKQSFLKSLPRRRVSGWRFALRQAAYIRKWVWALSFGIFLAGLAGGRLLERQTVWMLAAMMPLLAVSAVAEYARAEVWGMAELEMAARFGLKTVTLARMGILGAAHFGTLCLVSLLGGGEGISVFRTGIYLLVPYLATDVASLWMIRRLRGREGLYACLGLAMVVGAVPVLLRYAGGLAAWRTGEFHRWLWAAAFLGALAAFQWKKSIERTEELTWNL